MDSSISLPVVHGPGQIAKKSAFEDGKFTGSGSFQSHLSSIHTQQRIHTVRPSGSLPAVSSAQSSRAFTREKVGLPVSCIHAEESIVPGHKTHSYRLASFVRAHFTSVASSPGSTWVTPPSESLGKGGTHPHRSLGPASRAYPSSLRYMFYVYCCISLVFFSASLYRAGAGLQSPVPLDSESIHPGTSYLDSLAMDTRMARLTALRPLPVSFEPNFFHFRHASHIDRSDTVTACLWTQDDALGSHLLTMWMRRWPGPVSLVVKTTRISHAAKSTVLAKLNDIFAASSSPNSDATPNTTIAKPSRSLDVSVHLLVLHPDTPASPNAFLNLARLFSRTSHVLLLPSLSSPIPGPEALPFSPPPTPAIVTSRNGSVFPFLPWTAAPSPSGRTHTTLPYPPLSPILLMRDYPTWCTERFVSFPLAQTTDREGTSTGTAGGDGDSLARAADWDHCLFQFWIDAFGEMDSLPVAHGQAALQRPVRGPLSSTEIIHHRLAIRFRAETCVLALKRLEALAAASSDAVVNDLELRAVKRGKVAGRGGVNGGSADVGKVRWLKRACREWVNAS